MHWIRLSGSQLKGIVGPRLPISGIENRPEADRAGVAEGPVGSNRSSD